MTLAEVEHDLGQEVRAGHPRRSERERPGVCLRARRQRPPRVREQRLRAQHVVGEKLPGGGERRAQATSCDEPLADLGLERRDVFRDRRLADVKLLGGARERAAPGQRGEGPQARLQLHHLWLYNTWRGCI
jgi:hypothetical protein